MTNVRFLWATTTVTVNGMAINKPINFGTFAAAYRNMFAKKEMYMDMVNDGKIYRVDVESKMLEQFFTFIELEAIPNLVTCEEACEIKHADKWQEIHGGIFQMPTNYKNEIIKFCKTKPNVDRALLLQDEETLTRALQEYSNLFIYIE